MGGVDEEAGRVEGARWGGGKSGWRMGEEGGRACASCCYLMMIFWRLFQWLVAMDHPRVTGFADQ